MSETQGWEVIGILDMEEKGRKSLPAQANAYNVVLLALLAEISVQIFCDLPWEFCV